MRTDRETILYLFMLAPLAFLIVMVILILYGYVLRYAGKTLGELIGVMESDVFGIFMFDPPKTLWDFNPIDDHPGGYRHRRRLS